jgi:hypothetical protein
MQNILIYLSVYFRPFDLNKKTINISIA